MIHGCKFTELLNSTNPSIGIQVCGGMNWPWFHSPDMHTEYEQCLGSATSMSLMFGSASAFNQTLAFDTDDVTSVRRVHLCQVKPQRETKVLIFSFPSNFLSDGLHVSWGRSLQSTTILRYCYGYKCESIFVWTLTTMSIQILISYRTFLSDVADVR